MRYVYIPIYARNVYFTPDAEMYLMHLIENVKNGRTKKWIKSNLRHYLTNEYKAQKITPKTKLEHTPDWINEKRNIETLYYLTEKDLKKREFPLVKIVQFLDSIADKENITNMSIPDVLKKYATWKKPSNKETSIKKGVSLKGVTLVEKLKDGFAWYKVTGKQALINEGEMMQHCLKKGGYYNDVKRGKINIYSLRDVNNESHVTLEHNSLSNSLLQAKGKNNNPPNKKYIQKVLDFINDNNMDTEECNDILNLSNIVKLKNGILIDLNTYKGKIDIEGPFHYKGNIECNFPEISASTVSISDCKINSKKIISDTIYLDDCSDNNTITLSSSYRITIKNCSIKNIEIEEVPSKIYIHSSSLLLSSSSTLEEVKISSGICDVITSIDKKTKCNVLAIEDDSSIEYSIEIKDGCEVGEINCLPENVSLVLGKNVTIGKISKGSENIKCLSEGLHITESNLILDGNKLPKIESNIRINGKLIVRNYKHLPKEEMNKIKSIKCSSLILE